MGVRATRPKHRGSFVYTDAFVPPSTSTTRYVCMYVCMCVCMCVCVCVCIYVYVYTHTHTHTHTFVCGLKLLVHEALSY